MADTLRNHFGTNDAVGEKAMTVASAGTITILSFLLCNNTEDHDVVLDIYWDDNSDSSNQRFLYKSLSLPAASTFEHSDKIILAANDVLYYNMTSRTPDSSAPTQFATSYLLQT